jgi:hypothetical protein
MFVVGIAGSNKEPCVEEQALACFEEVLVYDDEEEPDVFVDSDIELAEPFLP